MFAHISVILFVSMRRETSKARLLTHKLKHRHAQHETRNTTKDKLAPWNSSQTADAMTVSW